MIRPSNAVLVAIDTDHARGPIAVGVSDTISVLAEAAQIVAIPTSIATFPTPVATGLIGRLSVATATSSYAFDPSNQAWSSTALARSIAATGRSQIIICGYWLEDAVTLLATHAMHAGLDAYVAIDACGTLDSTGRTTIQARLTQFNAVVTTARQIIREWGALSGDSQIFDVLAAKSNLLPNSS